MCKYPLLRDRGLDEVSKRQSAAIEVVEVDYLTTLATGIPKWLAFLSRVSTTPTKDRAPIQSDTIESASATLLLLALSIRLTVSRLFQSFASEIRSARSVRGTNRKAIAVLSIAGQKLGGEIGHEHRAVIRHPAACRAGLTIPIGTSGPVNAKLLLQVWGRDGHPSPRSPVTLMAFQEP
jgi:hypothetical protein